MATQFAENPEVAQASFASQFDLENPIQALSTYSRLIHAHTKSQMEQSLASSRSSSTSVSSTGTSSPSLTASESSTNPRRTVPSAEAPVSSLANMAGNASSESTDSQ